MGSLRQELTIPPHYIPHDEDDDDWAVDDDVVMMGSTPKVSTKIDSVDSSKWLSSSKLAGYGFVSRSNFELL